MAKYTWHYLWPIVVVATIFYFYALGRTDIVTDEASYTTRAQKMVDFDFGIEQPTPWQWVDTVPWWMHLSFHDHPPLVFLLEYYSLKAFGENPFAARVPSALAGVAAVLFLYAIAKRLYGREVGIASAALFAFTLNHVWISRVGMLESVLIALMLSAVYYFLRGLENPKWLPLSGALLGFAFLAKYHALILIPIFLTILIIRRRDILASRWLVFAGICFLVVISPVIIYNIQLYRNFGHLDFQFSLLFRENVKEWQARPGQETLGSTENRIVKFFPWLVDANSPYFLAIAALGLILIVAQIVFRNRHTTRELFVTSHWLLVICFLWLLPFLIFVGPAYRFLTILTPWLAIAAGFGLVAARDRMRIPAGVAATLFVLFLVLEGAYAYASVIAFEPLGGAPWAHSQLHLQNNAWGFNELEGFLRQKLDGKMPEVAITFQFPFARAMLDSSVSEGRRQGLEVVPWGIVYNDNINLSATLWTFLRRILYGGWPVVSAENFRSGGAEQFFSEAGVKHIIFINATPYALQDRARTPTPDGDIIERMLIAKGAKPQEIKNPMGDIAFRVYEFDIK